MLEDKVFWKQLIEEALKTKVEYSFLDFKLCLTNNNERLKEHINAFGNLERSGCFVFGVQDFMPVGIQEDADKPYSENNKYSSQYTGAQFKY